MKNHSLVLWCCATVAAPFLQLPQLQAAEEYPVHPDSVEQAGVPKGEVLNFTFADSEIFPGTVRTCWIYIPAQYDPATPACLYVQQDGLMSYEVPTVFDNLIHRGEMPITIGVFVAHGRVKSPDPETSWDRFNRSFEYDGMGDNYVRFLLKELLPVVETKTASDGRAIRLSTRATDRAIGGQSSGAICAFTAAWERPDSFSRVFSAIGTFVGLRGGNEYPTLIRKTEPKAIRVFLQDGSNDNNIYGGDWWMANQSMERSLIFAGYEVDHVWGEDVHSGRHGKAVFPDAMRWLWSGWPAAPQAGPSRNRVFRALSIPGEDWELASEGHRFTEGPVANAAGEVYFSDIPDGSIHKIALDGTVTQVAADLPEPNGQAFAPDGTRYTALMRGRKVIKFDTDGNASDLVTDLFVNDLVVANNGNIYLTNPPYSRSNDPSNIWLIKPDGEKSIVDTGLRYSNGVTLSADQTMLLVADYRTHWVYSYRIQSDGTLAAKQRFYDLHFSDVDDQSSADGMCVDRDGRLYVATNLGVQICDQLGRVNAIMPTPNGRVSNVCFGGENFDVLYATCGDRVYKRKLNIRGINAWEEPVKTPRPRL